MCVTVVWCVIGLLFAVVAVFMYICIGYMILFFETSIKKDEYNHPYVTVFEKMLFKKSIEMKMEPGIWVRDTDEFKKYMYRLEDLTVAFWPVVAVAEVINHWIRVESKM